jgi:hypothetical protein
MTTLLEAQEALATAQRKADDARLQAVQTSSRSNELRSAVVAGNEGITAQALATAVQEAEHASLVAQGAQDALPALSEAVSALKADEACDAITSQLRVLGSDVLDALDQLAGDIMPLAEAVKAYDSFVEQATRQVQTVGGTNPRLNIRRNFAPEVDRLSLRSCHGWEQLAAVIAPAAEALGAPHFAVGQLKELARSRPTLPSAP